MKNAYFALFAACLLAACSPKTPATSNGSINADSLKNSFLAVAQGAWVMNDYIAEIEKTHSPLQSASKLEGVVTLNVQDKVQGDSLEIPASWNNHEGYAFVVYFRPGTQANRLPTNLHALQETTDSYELGFETVNGATQLSLLHYDKSHALIDQRAFSKVPDAALDDLASGLQTIVNEKLIAGTFAIHDSSKNVGKITFNRDGTSTGYGDLKSYFVFTDFLGGPVPTFDEMAFNLMAPNNRRYAVDFKKDTILLHNMTGSEEEASLQRDKLKLTLIRE
jgi:hypothetical protein